MAQSHPVPRRPPLDLTKEAARLEKLVGPAALHTLRCGSARLHIWRGSSPHNWYIESLVTGEVLWHSDRKRDNWVMPNVLLFDKVSDSPERVPGSSFHCDGGKPFKSTFALKPGV